MAVTVKISETYDMKTSVGKVGVVGVHTPQLTVLRRLYPGLLKNHRFFRFVKCDVVGACASVLPADPLQVGVDAGDVAPEDMFNPILYTAVTNDSWDTLIGRIRSLSPVQLLGSVDAGDASSGDVSSNFNLYYAMLAENSKWRKVMPQSGFSIKGLVPLAHTVVSNFGNVGNNMDNNMALAEDGETPIPIPDMDIPDLDSSGTLDLDGDKSVFFRGRTVKMPRFPCHVGPEGVEAIPNHAIPKTTVLAMIIPPARLHEFYYRMRVTWTIRFEKVISTNEIGTYGGNQYNGSLSYGKNYNYTDSKVDMDNKSDMVMSDGVSIDKIMES